MGIYDTFSKIICFVLGLAKGGCWIFAPANAVYFFDAVLSLFIFKLDIEALKFTIKAGIISDLNVNH